MKKRKDLRTQTNGEQVILVSPFLESILKSTVIWKKPMYDFQ